jgi:hypothetical protein
MVLSHWSIFPDDAPVAPPDLQVEDQEELEPNQLEVPLSVDNLGTDHNHAPLRLRSIQNIIEGQQCQDM